MQTTVGIAGRAVPLAGLKIDASSGKDNSSEQHQEKDDTGARTDARDLLLPLYDRPTIR